MKAKIKPKKKINRKDIIEAAILCGFEPREGISKEQLFQQAREYLTNEQIRY